MKIKIISGGQTGVDRAALDAAIATRLPYGGVIPKGRIAEDGTISPSYKNLEEAPVSDYVYRTEQNVIKSDATLILGYWPMNGGTHMTNELCHKHHKVHTFIDLEKADLENQKSILSWINEIKPTILNVAGPRESKQPGIYQKVRLLLENVFKKL